MARVIELSRLTGEQGFLIQGAEAEDSLGSSVSTAGDVNGDGTAGETATTDIQIGGVYGDRMQGWGGDDDMFGGLGDDTLRGGDGNDRLFAHTGDDVLWGQSGDDLLRAGAGIDTLMGGDGSVALVGGAEADTLVGVNGVDLFVFETLAKRAAGTGRRGRRRACRSRDHRARRTRAHRRQFPALSPARRELR